MFPRTLLILLSTLLMAVPLIAADDDVVVDRRLVVIGGEGGQATVTFDGDRLQVVSVEDGDVSVHEFDFSHLGEIIDEAVAEAMFELDEVFAEDLSIHVEDGNMIHVSHGDRACAFNVELLAQEIQNSLASVHAHFGRELRHAHGIDDADEQVEMADLQAELDRLKAELERLRDDLDRVR